MVTTERVVISREGRVEGNVKCSSALISGRVRGNIVALEALTLQVPAHIKGNILTKNIISSRGLLLMVFIKL
ncbi:MAG: polymer-forming cytoskeletal protein [Butyricimonas faecihominis]